MPSAEKLPFVVIGSRELAQWLDSQPETWWTVDGDPLLTSELDLPCPAQELSAALRKHDRNLLVMARDSTHHGETIDWHDLNSLSQQDRRSDRNFLLRWESGDQPWWLLSECADEPGNGRA